MNQATITLKDGRTVGYAEYGAAAGVPLFSFHGTPGSRIVSQVYDRAATAAGLRIIAPERPGYGLSSRAPDRHIEDYPAEIAEIANHFGFERFVVVGSSGGAIYAASCAALLLDRVIAAGLVSSMMPLIVPGMMTGMALPNQIFFGLARWLPGVAGSVVSRMTLASLGSADQHIANRTSPVASIPPEQFAIVVADFRAALVQGGAGAALDMGNLWRKPAFAFEAIRVPTFIMARRSR